MLWKYETWKNNKEIVCVSSGLIQGYKYVKEYINENENKFTIMRKSIIIESITFIIQSSINVKGTIYKYPRMIKIRY